MTNFGKLALATLVGLSLVGATLSADSAKGQKLYKKKLKSACGFSGAAMAAKHTQDEWDEINDAGKMKDEIKTLCPSVKDKALKSKYLGNYYDFFHNFASDSGNVPSC